jgi:hypothetical protein
MTSVRENAIKAIPTRYAGCHFRSRLEARWAVFFDALGIRWEYEPQGFELRWRLLNNDDTFQYLPDFWLPDMGIHVEVKGVWTSGEMEKFFNAVAAMGTCRNDGEFVNFVTLGSTDGYQCERWAPMEFHFHKGDLYMSPWDVGGGGHCTGTHAKIVASDYGVPESWLQHGWTTESLGAFMSLGGKFARGRDTKTQAALTAARSARFEHGQSGAA